MAARHRLALIAPLFLASTVFAAKPQPALDSLVAAERGFAAMSVEKGMKDAFLANLADDGVVFAPLPTNGRQRWEGREPAKGQHRPGQPDRP